MRLKDSFRLALEHEQNTVGGPRLDPAPLALLNEFVCNVNGLRFYVGSMGFLVLFYTLFDHHCLSLDAGGTTSYSAGGTYADLPFHMNIISSFLYGANMQIRLVPLSCVCMCVGCVSMVRLQTF